MTKTPASLLDRLRTSSDDEAWARFVALYTPLIYFWGRRVGLQSVDAADLVQDVLTTVLRVLPTFAYDRHKSFRAWLRTVTLNLWRNKQKHSSERTRSGADPDQLAAPDTLEAFWEDEYRRHLAGRALAIMRADFEEKTWRACWEVTVAGRPAADVAAELGMTAGAVYAAKFRVLDRLRRDLDGLLD